MGLGYGDKTLKDMFKFGDKDGDNKITKSELLLLI
jgi:hypothetical protein